MKYTKKNYGNVAYDLKNSAGEVIRLSDEEIEQNKAIVANMEAVAQIQGNKFAKKMNVLPPIISLLILRCAGTGHAVQGGAALTVEGGTWYWKVNCQGPVAGGRMMDEGGNDAHCPLTSSPLVSSTEN